MKIHHVAVGAIVMAAGSVAFGAVVGVPITMTPGNTTAVGSAGWRDNVATQAELNHHGTSAALSQHTFSFQVFGAYVPHSDVTARFPAGIGLPDNGQITSINGGIEWNYQMHTQWQAATLGDGLGANALAVRPQGHSTAGHANQTAAATVNLLAAEQGQYDSMNIIFMSRRAIAGQWTTFSSSITAHYADGTSAVVAYNSFHGNGSLSPGGTFGSAGALSEGGPYTHNENNQRIANTGYLFDDQAPEVEAAYLMTYGYRQSGATWDINTMSIALWTFKEPVQLDSSRVLESLTFTTFSDRTNYQNELYVFGVSAYVPEPGSAAALGLVGALLCLPRRRRI